jgi:hypothetical protein
LIFASLILKLFDVKKQILFLLVSLFLGSTVVAQSGSAKGSFLKPNPRNYEVKQAFEVESLVPMFLSGGYHFALGYRYNKFRVRVSVINGGNYDAEPAGLVNTSPDFKRYYKTSPGFFFGYNLWRNLELYTYVESHTFGIEQVATSVEKNIHSADFGGGVSYQFFLGRHFYIQPGLHIYLRTEKSANFSGTIYNIPNADFAPVLRLGYRLWSKY